MLAIVDYLTSQGFGPDTAEHMRIPGIWQKLRSLYNLEALDERVGNPRLSPAIVPCPLTPSITGECSLNGQKRGRRHGDREILALRAPARIGGHDV